MPGSHTFPSKRLSPVVNAEPTEIARLRRFERLRASRFEGTRRECAYAFDARKWVGTPAGRRVGYLRCFAILLVDSALLLQPVRRQRSRLEEAWAGCSYTGSAPLGRYRGTCRALDLRQRKNVSKGHSAKTRGRRGYTWIALRHGRRQEAKLCPSFCSGSEPVAKMVRG